MNHKLSLLLVFLFGLLLGAAGQHNRHYFNDVISKVVAYWNQPQFEWTMVNVNQTIQQGDAHFIRVKNGKTILIDVGSEAPAQQKLIPFLKNRSINHIDTIYITHGHTDHYAGLRPLLNSGITIDKVVFNIPNKTVCDREIPWGCNYNDIISIRKQLQSRGVKVLTTKGGDKYNLGNGAFLHVLYAFNGMNSPIGMTDINDSSLIMKLNYKRHQFMFSGDLNRALGTYVANHSTDLSSDVVKIPHHGTEGIAPNIFFKKVNAKFALIPSPRHLWCTPRSSRVRNWYQNQNIKTYVNGFHGHVSVFVDSDQLSVSPEHNIAIACP